MDIYNFILQHEHEDIHRLLLEKQAHIPNIKWVVQQIEGRKIAKSKLPFLYAHTHIHYPHKLSLEQCSSELTAQYKAALMYGKTCIDLTGGLGIDTLFLSKNFEKMVYIEKNATLTEIFKHNLSVLNIQNVEPHCTDSISFLKQDTNVYSWLYEDPARRDNAGKKVFLLSDCEPDILTHWNLISKKADNILLKTSPLLDIKHVWENLSVTSTHVVAVKNEVKEVLYLIEKGKERSENIICADITEQNINFFEGNLSDEQNTEARYALPQQYLYEPNKSILKAGLFKTITKRYPVFKIAPNSHLYTADTFLPHFMGRVFRAKHVIPYQKKAFQSFNTATFNIIARNFPDTPEQIAKKLSVRTGGETAYLIATRDYKNQVMLILCERLY